MISNYVIPKAHSISRKAPTVTSLAGRPTGIDVQDVIPNLVPDMPVHQFLQCFSIKDDSLISQHALASV
jgi:hypothetical protein